MDRDLDFSELADDDLDLSREMVKVSLLSLLSVKDILSVMVTVPERVFE